MIMSIYEWETENIIQLEELYEYLLTFPNFESTYEEFVRFCYNKSS